MSMDTSGEACPAAAHQYTTVTSHNGPNIEQCTDLDGARHDMMLRCGAGDQPKLDLIRPQTRL